jgi:anti-anti-sigma factor
MKLTLLAADGDVTQVRTEGDVTQIDLHNGDGAWGDVLGPECFTRKVRLNMEKTNYIDSAGVGWLISSNNKFRDGGGKLTIYAISPMVMQILKLLRMPEVLNIEG